MSVTVGIDVGGTNIQTAALRGEEVVASLRTPTPLTGARDLRRAIVSAVAETLALTGADRGALDAIGIAIPGSVDTRAGTVASAPNLPGFESPNPIALGPAVSQTLGGLPVTLGNDVSLAVLGEHRRGAGRGYRNLLGVWIGTGVGGGLILDGELHEGRGAAGEIGHMLIEPAGRLCSCGQRGHLESYAGRGRMEARARELVKKGRRTSLFRLAQKRGKDRVTSSVWLEAVRKEDRIATMLLDEAVWALGIALASAQNLLDLEAIVIGGGLGDRLGPSFLDRLEREIRPQLFSPGRPPRLLPTTFRDLSGAVGAVVAVEER